MFYFDVAAVTAKDDGASAAKGDDVAVAAKDDVAVVAEGLTPLGRLHFIIRSGGMIFDCCILVVEDVAFVCGRVVWYFETEILIRFRFVYSLTHKK